MQQFLKSTYKKDVYIPWATMERLLYQQDPEATFELIPNQYTPSDPVITHTEAIITLIDGKETRITSIGYFVSVAVTFLGKRITEDAYPIQDKAYDAPKVIDSNMVNKSIKRALTKAAARASGIGLKLYEDKDLQFEQEGATPLAGPVSTVPTDMPAPVATPSPAPTPVVVPNASPASAPVVDGVEQLREIAKELHGNPALQKGIQIVNPAIIKKYKFSLLADGDDVEATVKKLAQLSVPMNTYNTIRVQSGLEKA